MDMANEDETLREAREKAAMLLRDRHERESEALAELLAAIAHRKAAAEIVERATAHIESRLAEMSRFGFGDTTLAELGVEIADFRATGGSRTREQAFHEERPMTPPAETGSSGDGNADTNAPDHRADEHVGGLRTTADLASMHSPAGVTTRAWSRPSGRVEPGTARTR